jgi:hypothetical protein
MEFSTRRVAGILCLVVVPVIGIAFRLFYTGFLFVDKYLGRRGLGRVVMRAGPATRPAPPCSRDHRVFFMPNRQRVVFLPPFRHHA